MASPPQKTPPLPHENLPRLENWRQMVQAHKVFTPEECGRICDLMTDTRPGAVSGDAQSQTYRKSNISWLQPKPEHRWIFERARQVVVQANKDVFQMELAGYTEPLQLTEYGPGQFCEWHLDFGNGKYSVRKLSFVVQLTDPAAYEGGDLQMFAHTQPQVAMKDQGNMILFPSFIVHRVTEVTAGLRRSLVGWIGGPHYR